jgi:hypothetical protein
MDEVLKEIESRVGTIGPDGKWYKDKSPEARAKWYKAQFKKCVIQTHEKDNSHEK